MNLWALTPYFNASHCSRRRANFDVFSKRFRDGIGVPLAVAELGFGKFEIPEDAADRVLRFGGGDLMWQKERLFNQAVPLLPVECDVVVLLDADVVFANSGAQWIEDLEKALSKQPIVQPFTRWAYINNAEAPRPKPTGSSLVRAYPQRGAIGGAWAFRREILENIGFYDACVIGGGDSATANGWLDLGSFGLNMPARMSSKQAVHYRKWLDRARRYQGCVSCCGGTAYFINHAPAATCGKFRGTWRLDLLIEAGFDPVRHLRLGCDGCWEWASAAPKNLRQRISGFLLGRDGVGSIASVVPKSSKGPKVKPIRGPANQPGRIRR